MDNTYNLTEGWLFHHCSHSNPGVKASFLEIELQPVLNTCDHLYFCFLSRPFPKATHILFKVAVGILSTFFSLGVDGPATSVTGKLTHLCKEQRLCREQDLQALSRYQQLLRRNQK